MDSSLPIKSCPQCGAVLPAQAPLGLCPKCLLLGAGDSGFGLNSAMIGPDSAFLIHEPPSSNIGDECIRSESGPERIGVYRLLERIGEGGFGIVYRAEQTEPITREVALKVIKPGMDSREIIQRLPPKRLTRRVSAF